MRDVRNEVGFLADSVQGLSAIGRTMTLAVTTPLVAMGTFSVQAASEFDASMRNINAIAQVSEEELQALSDAVLEFGKHTRGGPLSAARAMYTAFSSGIDEVSTAMQFMEIASKTAEAGLADLETTTKALVASFLAYGGDKLPITEQFEMVAEHADALTQMVAVGVGTMEAFAGSLGGVLPTARAIGAEIRDLYGSIAFLTQRGLSASEASVSMNAAMTALLKPSKAMKQAFAELGVTTGQDLVEKFGGLEGALKAVISTADGSAEQLAKLFTNVRAFRAVGLLFDDLEGWSDALEEFEKGMQGVVDRAHAEQMKSFAATFDLMKSAVQGLAIAVGEQLFPVLRPAMQHLTTLMNELSSLHPDLLAVAVGFLGITAAAGPLIWVVSSLMTPIGVLVGGLGALAIAFATNFGDIRTTVETVVQDITGDLSGLSTLIDDVLKILFPEDPETEVKNAVPDPVEVDVSNLVTFTVQEGEGPWHVWAREFKDDMSFEAFLEAIEWQDGQVWHAGDQITIDTTTGKKVADGLINELVVADGEVDAWINENGIRVDTNEILKVERRGAGDEADELTVSLWSRIKAALYVIRGRLPGEINAIIDTTIANLNHRVGDGLKALANVFTGGEGDGKGGTPFYQELRKLLTTDLSGIGEFLSSNPAISNITEGFKTLFDNLTLWLENTGLPTFARSAGYISARMGIILSEIIRGALGLVEGTDVSGATKLGEDLAAAWNEGVNDAFTDMGYNPEEINAGDRFVTAITGALAAAVTVSAVSDGLLGTDFGSKINSGVSAALGGVKWVFTLGATAAGAFAGQLAIALGKAVAGTALSIAVGALSVLVNIGSYVIGFAAGTVARLAGALALKLGAAVAGIGAIPLTLGAGMIAVATAAGAMVWARTDYNFREQLAHWLVEERGQDPFEVYAEFGIHPALSPQAAQNLMLASDGDFATFMKYWFNFEMPRKYTYDVQVDVGIQMQEDAKNEDLDPDAQAALDYAGRVVELEGIAQAAIEGVVLQPQSVTLDENYSPDLTLPQVEANVSSVFIREPQLADFLPPPEAQQEQIAENVADAVMPEEKLSEKMTETLKNAADTAALNLATHLINNGVTDVDSFVTDFLEPLDSKWTEYLGEEGHLSTTTSNWAATTALQIGDVALAFTELGLSAEEEVGNVSRALSSKAPGIERTLALVKLAVDNVTKAFIALAEAARDALNVSVTVPGGPEIDGAAADGGFIRAGETFLVGERGPELFTTRRSGEIIPTEALVSGLRMDGGRGDTITNNNTFNEVRDLDRMLYEARRRGVRLA